MISNYITEFKKWFKQGEIWWCSVGYNLGEEIFGKGEKFTSSSFSGIPLTSKEKQGTWYTEITLHGKKNGS